MFTPGSKWHKAALLALALALVVIAGLCQRQLNRQRTGLGLTRIAPLESAPPMLAFTTVALGGFRGLIANALWVRATDLQEEGKYFEMVQLADWITKLQPTFVQVWVVQAWNMAYNISVKFSDLNDRWRWVERGIQLLRDEGIRYNPNEALLYRELSWFFQHKMGQNLDEAHWVYKQTWAREMTAALGPALTNLAELVNPATDEARRRATQLREKYKLDPARLKQVDDTWGPLDWRTPEAHAIYWAVLGLEKSKPKDQVTLRRAIYQSMAASALRGRFFLAETGRGTILRTGPNLDIATKANDAYEKMIADEPDTGQRDSFKRAQQVFLREMVYLNYTHNRLAEARRWFQSLREKYPDFIPKGMDLEAFALDRLADNIRDFNYDRTKTVLEGLVRQYVFSAAIDDDERAVGLKKMAEQLRKYYDDKTRGQQRLKMPTIAEIEGELVPKLLEPGSDLGPQLQLRLKTKYPHLSGTNSVPTAPVP